jgi:hypothetical protein
MSGRAHSARPFFRSTNERLQANESLTQRCIVTRHHCSMPASSAFSQSWKAATARVRGWDVTNQPAKRFS